VSRVLALDTSSWWGGLALLEGSADASVQVLAEVGFHVPASHAVHLMPRVEWLLNQSGWTKSSVDAYVAVRGPGSFTGIRVGLGTAHGLALAAGRPVIGVGSLVAMAEAAGPMDEERLPVRDAGRGEVYLARYDSNGCPPREIAEPRMAHATHVAALAERAVLLAEATFDEIPADSRHRLRRVRAPRHLAAAAGRLAILRTASEQETPVPLYLRLPDAEVKARRR